MLPGCGDQATWGKCCGHPHDPRTPEYDEEIDMSFIQTTHELRKAANTLDTVDSLLDDLTSFFEELLEDRAVTGDREYDITCFMNRMKNI